MQKRRKDFKSERRENSIAGKKYGIISFTLTLVIFLVHLIFGELLLGPVSLRTHLLVTWLVSFSLTLSQTHTHSISSFECTNTRTLMMLTRTLSHSSACTPCALRIARETKFLHQMSKDVKVRLSTCLVVSVCVCERERNISS